MGARGSSEPPHHVHHQVAVERVVEKVVIRNPQKERFEQNQDLLARILNGGFDGVRNRNKKCIMSIGPSGSGKSTTLNLFYKTQFTTAPSSSDVTVEMTVTETDDKTIVDTVGFLPSLPNIGKMFILLFYRGVLPDYLLFPANNDRIVDILELNQLVKFGFLRFMVVPFSAQVFYAMKEFTSDEQAVKKALERAPVSDMKEFIRMNQMEANISVYENESSVPVGSMREVFLRTFFKDGKYEPKSYEEHMNSIKTNPTEILRGLMIDAINDLYKHASIENGSITRINECNFLKG